MEKYSLYVIIGALAAIFSTTNIMKSKDYIRETCLYISCNMRNQIKEHFILCIKTKYPRKISIIMCICVILIYQHFR